MINSTKEKASCLQTGDDSGFDRGPERDVSNWLIRTSYFVPRIRILFVPRYSPRDLHVTRQALPSAWFRAYRLPHNARQFAQPRLARVRTTSTPTPEHAASQVNVRRHRDGILGHASPSPG